MSIPEVPESDGRPKVLPFWGLCDESGSMAGAPVDAINDALPRLHAAVRADFDVDEIIRFGLIAFASGADESLPLCELGSIDAMPGLTAGGTTDYGAAFRALRAAIERAVPALQAEGYDVLRPVVFFFSDGAPDGGPDGPWLADLEHLLDPNFAYRPHIVAFGIGDATDPAVIARVGTLKAYQSTEGMDVAEAVRQWATRLTQSIVASARGVASGTTSLVIPPTPDGFQEIPLGVLPGAPV